MKLPEIIKRIQPSTVLILTYDNKGEIKKQGSGFFISKDGNIVTSHHVLEAATQAEIKTSKGKIYPIKKILAESKEDDIVLASVDIPQELVHPLTLSKSIPEVGEKVIVIGNPLGLEQTISDGIVSAVREIPQFGEIIQITVPVSSGSSGSPVINIKGEVIGVATFQIVEGQNLNFAIPSEKVDKLKPGKGKTLAEWEASEMEQGLASAEGLYDTGLSFLWIENYEKALSYFQKAIEKNPRYADAYFQIGYCNDKLGRFSDAIEAYKQAIRIKPDFAEAHINLGWAYYNLGRFSDAIEAYKQAIRIKPDFAEAHINLGVAYGELGRFSDAIEAFKQAIRIKPDYAKAHYNLGVIYVNLGRFSDAIEAYKQAIRIKPDFAEAHINLGVAYGELGRFSDAIEAFKQAIRIKPDYAMAYFNLGLTYLILGDKDSALEEYKILKDLDTESANKLFNLIYK